MFVHLCHLKIALSSAVQLTYYAQRITEWLYCGFSQLSPLPYSAEQPASDGLLAMLLRFKKLTGETGSFILFCFLKDTLQEIRATLFQISKKSILALR